MKNLTCIVGLVNNGNVYIGGDSAGVDSTSICIRKDKKVFVNGPFIMGFTNSFRMGQLLQFKFSPPDQTCSDDFEFMVTDFIDKVKECFIINGFLFDKDDSMSGAFLVGYKSNLYIIDIDFQVGMVNTPFYSVGCGADLALGAMYATQGKKPEQRIKIALEAASEFSSGVAPPFNIVKQIKRRKR